MTINFRGYIFDDAGNAVSGASVKLLDTGTATQEGSTVTSDSNGLWNFDDVSEADAPFDVEITKGSSVRRIRWQDQISLKEIDVRNGTGNTTPAATFTNFTNNIANQVAVFRGANSTRADGDEIYLSFKLADSAGNLDEFARITAEATDVTNGSEDGQMRFGVAVAGQITDVFTINSTTGGAAEISYEVDSFTIKGGEGEAGVLYLFADQGDDAGDEWKVNVADGGVLTIGNDIASAGTYVTMMTITPHATTASSSVAIAGDATVGDDLSLTSDSSVFNMGAGNDFKITHDGTTGATLSGNPVTITASGASTWSTSSGALTITSAAALNLTPAGGSAILLDGTISVDAGVVTGATSITSTAFVGTLSTAAQANVTSLGTLTALTVDDVAVNGKVITMTGDTNDTTVITAGTHGTLSIVTTDTAAAAANIQVTADGTVDIDSAGILTLDSGAAINIEPADGSAILLDGTISIDAGVVTGVTALTSATVDATTDFTIGDTVITNGVITDSSGLALAANVTVTGNVLPNADDTYDLGSASAAWQDIFLEGDITLSDAGTIATSAGALTITSAAAATWSTAAGVLTIDGDDGIVMQTTGSGGVDIKENLTLTSVDGGATGPILNLFHDTGSASATGGQDNGDRLGVIDFLDTDGVIRGEISCALEGNTSQAGFHFRLAGDATNDKLYITRDGNATLLGTLTESSDERLKANVATLTGSLAKVKQMRGVSFTRNDLTDKTQTHLGLIAQELELVASELVSTGANGFKAVAYSQLSAYLIEAIKELDTRITALE